MESYWLFGLFIKINNRIDDLLERRLDLENEGSINLQKL